MTGNEVSRKLPPPQLRELCRALALDAETHAALAREFGISRSYVSMTAKRRAREIKAIREAIKAGEDAAFAGMWIASKASRLAAYQADYERSLAGAYSDHFEQLRTRAAIMRNVAEELGELPTRTTAAIITPVIHVIVGDVDLDALK